MLRYNLIENTLHGCPNIKLNTDCTVCLGLQASDDVTFTPTNLNSETDSYMYGHKFLLWPKFLGCIDNQILLATVLCGMRFVHKRACLNVVQMFDHLHIFLFLYLYRCKMQLQHPHHLSFRYILAFVHHQDQLLENQLGAHLLPLNQVLEKWQRQ